VRVVVKASLRSSRERRVVRFDVVYGPDAASSDPTTCSSKPPELREPVEETARHA
jgi:hypothetical protein